MGIGSQLGMIAAMALSVFVIGGLWYSKLLFGARWCVYAGIDMDKPQGHPARVFGVSLLLSALAAFGFVFLFGEPASLHLSLHNGLMVGFFFVFTSFGINYQFANRPWPMLFIDGGYHLLQFAAYGLIVGLWPR